MQSATHKCPHLITYSDEMVAFFHFITIETDKHYIVIVFVTNQDNYTGGNPSKSIQISLTFHSYQIDKCGHIGAASWSYPYSFSSEIGSPLSIPRFQFPTYPFLSHERSWDLLLHELQKTTQFFHSLLKNINPNRKSYSIENKLLFYQQSTWSYTLNDSLLYWPEIISTQHFTLKRVN